MKKGILLWSLLVCSITLFIPRMALAFGCGSAGSTYNITATAVPIRTTENPVESASFSTTCSGSATSAQKDAMRIQSVTTNALFTNAGYSVEVALGGGAWQTASAVLYACIWPGNNTSYNCTAASSTNSGGTRSVKIRLRRSTNGTFTTIPSGTTIATIVSYQRSNGTWSGSGGWAKITLTYKLNGDLNSVVPTCEVKDFDGTVQLPVVQSVDLIDHGIGRYATVKKPLKIALECEDDPKVNVTFNGTTMAGTNDEVLANLETGNTNVGIQLEYVDSYSTTKKTVKSGTAFQVLESAMSNETLNFNAYYYYKGGTIYGGKIKSQAEFLFNYQ